MGFSDKDRICKFKKNCKTKKLTNLRHVFAFFSAATLPNIIKIGQHLTE